MIPGQTTVNNFYSHTDGCNSLIFPNQPNNHTVSCWEIYSWMLVFLVMK